MKASKPPASKPNCDHILTGILLANDWDEDGKPIGVVIYSVEEEVYGVAYANPALKLLDYIQMKVTVRGYVRMSTNGEKVIHINSLKVLEEGHPATKR